MSDTLPDKYIRNDYHESKRWYLEIEWNAGDKPVAFTNSYQNASKHTIYTGKFSHSLNNLNYRKNHYDIWDFEEKLNGIKRIIHFHKVIHAGLILKFLILIPIGLT